MRKNVNVVGDYTCGQFYQVRIYTEHDEGCAECLKIKLSSISATS